MVNLKINLDPPGPDWEAVLHNSSSASIIHSENYLSYLKGTKKDVLRYCIYDSSTPIGIGYHFTKRGYLPLWSYSYSGTRFGHSPVFRDDYKLTQKVADNILDLFMKDVIPRNNPLAFYSYKWPSDVWKGLRITSSLKKIQNHSCLLRYSKNMMQNFSKNCRYSVRRSQQNNLKISRSGTLPGLKSFYGLYLETSRRAEFLPEPYAKIKLFFQKLKDGGMVDLWLVHKDDVPVSGALVGSYNDKNYLFYLASDDKGRRLLSNYLLINEVCDHYHKLGFCFLDMGGLNADGASGSSNYAKFKKSFNPKIIENNVYVLISNKLLYNALRRLKRIIPVV
jgi:hypothetical protein